MRDYARLCEGTRKYASLASVCEAPFGARYASSHARKYAPTPLKVTPHIIKRVIIALCTASEIVIFCYDAVVWDNQVPISFLVPPSSNNLSCRQYVFLACNMHIAFLKIDIMHPAIEICTLLNPAGVVMCIMLFLIYIAFIAHSILLCDAGTKTQFLSPREISWASEIGRLREGFFTVRLGMNARICKFTLL